MRIPEKPVHIALAQRPRLAIYFRPGGDIVAGHEQIVGLGILASVAAHGRLPDFPPGWFVSVRGGRVAALDEDSGIRPTVRPSVCPAT